MTIKEARKLLGKEADKLSDEDLAHEIETAQFLSHIFKDFYVQKLKCLDEKSFKK